GPRCAAMARMGRQSRHQRDITAQAKVLAAAEAHDSDNGRADEAARSWRMVKLVEYSDSEEDDDVQARPSGSAQAARGPSMDVKKARVGAWPVEEGDDEAAEEERGEALPDTAAAAPWSWRSRSSARTMHQPQLYHFPVRGSNTAPEVVTEPHDSAIFDDAMSKPSSVTEDDDVEEEDEAMQVEIGMKEDTPATPRETGAASVDDDVDMRVPIADTPTLKTKAMRDKMVSMRHSPYTTRSSSRERDDMSSEDKEISPMPSSTATSLPPPMTTATTTTTTSKEETNPSPFGCNPVPRSAPVFVFGASQSSSTTWTAAATNSFPSTTDSPSASVGFTNVFSRSKTAPATDSARVPNSTERKSIFLQCDPFDRPVTQQAPDSQPTSWTSKFGHFFGAASSSVSSTPPVPVESMETKNGRRRRLNPTASLDAKPTPPAQPTSRRASPFGTSEASAKPAFPFVPWQAAGESSSSAPTTGFDDNKSSTTSTRSHVPPPMPQSFQSPPVDHLKDNFDGFRIGSAPPASSSNKKTKSQTPSRSPARPSTFTFGQPSDQASPFGTNVFSNRGSDATQKAKVSSSPADPFAIPVFRPSTSTTTKPQSPCAVRQRLNFSADEASNEPPQSKTFVFGESSSQNSSVPPSASFQFGANTSSKAQSNFGSVTAASDADLRAMFGLPTTDSTVALERRVLHARKTARAQRAAFKQQSAVARKESRHRDAPESDGEGSEETTEEDDMLADWGELKRRGGQAYSARDYQSAADFYCQSIDVVEKILEVNPAMNTWQLRNDKAKLHANRAAALMMLMQINEAQRECRAALEEDHTYVKAYLRLAKIQLLFGETTNVRENLMTARRLCDSTWPAEMDATDQATIEKLQVSVQKLEKLQDEVKWCLDVGDFAGALLYMNDALVIAPSCRTMQVQKAEALFKKKSYGEVVTYCVELARKLRSGGQRPKMNDIGGRSKEPKALAMDKAEKEVGVLGIELSLWLATALHYQGKHDDAMMYLSALEAAAPCSEKVIQCRRKWDSMRSLKHQANDLFKIGNYQRAVSIYSQALQLDRDNDEFCGVVYCNRAAALMGIDKFDSALLDCEEALKRKPHYPRALLRRARCHVALEKYAQAIRDFDRYLKEQPRDTACGSVDEVLAERKAALQALERTREAQEQQRAEAQRRQQQQHHYQYAHRSAWEDASASSSGYLSWSYSQSFRGSAGSSDNQQSQRGHSSRSAPRKHQRSHYDVLGVAHSATQDDIKKAYRKLARQHHPDKAKDQDAKCEDLFKDMTAAYNVLSDNVARAKYDRELSFGGFGNNFYGSAKATKTFQTRVTKKPKLDDDVAVAEDADKTDANASDAANATDENMKEEDSKDATDDSNDGDSVAEKDGDKDANGDGSKVAAPTATSGFAGFAGFASFKSSSSSGFSAFASSASSGFGGAFGSSTSTTATSSGFTGGFGTTAEAAPAATTPVATTAAAANLAETDVNNGEEGEEVVIEKRAKLFKLVEKDFVEVGIGPMRLLKPKSAKDLEAIKASARVVMRRESYACGPGTKLILNARMTAFVSCVRRSEKAMAVTILEKQDDDENVKPSTYLIRVGNPDDFLAINSAITEHLPANATTSVSSS
ncbi:TPA: LOW QUALITY PROTEIN: hypothetical protein N0F65_007948, partial [Lagenidium giganteum]